MNFKQKLEHLNATIWSENKACSEALEWIDDKTLEQAWNTCERPGWMFWLLGRIDGFDVELHKIACDIAEDCVEKYWAHKYPDDKRPQKAIAAKRAWIEDPSEEHAKTLETAWAAAYSAESAAWSAADTAGTAAESAAESASKSAVYAAVYAAESAAWYAESAARSAVYADVYASNSAPGEQHCEVIRRYVTAEMVEKEMNK